MNDKAGPESGKRKKSEKSLPIVKWFERQGCYDIYRTLNPHGKDYTWSRGDLKTRIDYIWVTEKLAMELKEAKVEDMTVYTGSDHNSPVAEIKLKHLTSNYSKAAAKKKGFTRSVFLYKEAKQEDWENYKIELNKRIVRAESIKKWIIDLNPIVENEIEGALDSMKRPRLDKIIVELSRWVKYAKKKVGNEVMKEEKEDFEKFREYIKKKYQEEKDIEGLRGWWKILFIKNSERVEREKLKQIKENIKKHCQIIDGDQRRMLASLLEKPFKCAIIDKIIESSNNSRTLISKPLQVKKKTRDSFQRQFRKRGFKTKALGKEWSQ
ncbi:12810_t:CDS:2, partial [Gigaspora rosea]